MPYIDKETAQKIRKEIKENFPNWKFSIRTLHNSCIDVSILESPLSYSENYTQINEFYIKEHMKDAPEWINPLQKILDIMNQKNGTLVIDGDYGRVPLYYTHINIGKWDKSYKQINNS